MIVAMAWQELQKTQASLQNPGFVRRDGDVTRRRRHLMERMCVMHHTCSVTPVMFPSLLYIFWMKIVSPFDE